jgi:hypothetical protein
LFWNLNCYTAKVSEKQCPKSTTHVAGHLKIVATGLKIVSTGVSFSSKLIFMPGGVKKANPYSSHCFLFSKKNS